MKKQAFEVGLLTSLTVCTGDGKFFVAIILMEALTDVHSTLVSKTVDSQGVFKNHKGQHGLVDSDRIER